jgi:two-component system cell cycle response regulator
VETLKILIIEDDDDQRDLILETLEDHFGRGTVTGVGSRADALKQDLKAFDLILSDYNLPDSTGMELLDAIQQRCKTPVIMVTGENVGHIAAEAIRKGATDYVVKFGDYLFTIPLVVEKNLTVANVKRENESLRGELERALTEVQEKNHQLEESLKRVEQMAATDPLTGLYNRRHFGRVIEQLFGEAYRLERDLACVMIDMDGFKQLNDSHGHQVGDTLLMAAGKCISANCRTMDIAARYGGDEFVLLIPAAGIEQATLVADRIRAEFKQASSAILKRETPVSMSVGIATLVNNRPNGADQLVALADQALYTAKEHGRDRIATADICIPRTEQVTAPAVP